MEDGDPSREDFKEDADPTTEQDDILARYQNLWERAAQLDDETSESYPLDQYNPENLSSGVRKIIITELENLVEDLEHTASRSSESTSRANDTAHIPTRYQKLWQKVTEVVDCEPPVYPLEEYDPEGLSGGDWLEKITGLEQILCIEADSTLEYDFDPSTMGSIRVLSRSELVINRLESVVDTEATENSIEEIVADDDQLREWLQVWARWESLLRAQSTDRKEIQVTEIDRLRDPLGMVLEEQGYGTLSELRRAKSDELCDIEGLDEQSASDLQSWPCSRQVRSIQGVSSQLQQRLNNSGLWTAADLTAVPTDQVAEVGGISNSRARDIRERAAAWLPPNCNPPESLKQRFEPPYESLKTARLQLDRFEDACVIHSEIAPLITQLETSHLEVPDRDILTTRIYKEYLESSSQTDSERRQRVQAWTDVLRRLVSLVDQIDDEQFSSAVRSRFDLSELPAVEIDITTICEANTPSEASERIASAEQVARQNTELKQLASDAAAIQDRVEASSISDTAELYSAISRQMDVARNKLEEGSFSEYRDHVEEYLIACQKTLDLVQDHPNYEFDSLIPVLAEGGQHEQLPTTDIEEVTRIVGIAKEALEFLEKLDYDHPAVDAGSWRESIETAVSEQYPRILSPVEKELARLDRGLWDPEDLEAYEWREFEEVIGNLYRDEGYDVEVTQSTADLGVDLWATDGEDVIAIQVKHYQAGNTVGRQPLQKVVSTLAKGDADRAEVITSSEFAETATQYATDFGSDLTLTSADDLIVRLSESRLPPPS